MLELIGVTIYVLGYMANVRSLWGQVDPWILLIMTTVWPLIYLIALVQKALF